MRKKFFSALLLMTLAVPLTGALVSCSDYDDDISSLRDDVTSLKSQLETTKSDLEAQLTTIKGDFAAQIQAAVEGKADKSEVEELKVSLDAAESKLQAQIDAINEALEGLDAGKINDAIETLAAVTGDVEKLKTDVDGIDQRVGAVEKNLKIQQDALAAFLEAIQSNGYENVDELIAAVKDAQGTISELQDKVSANAGDISALKGSMEDAEEALATLNTTVAGLQGQIDALTVYIEKMLSGLVFAPDFYYGGIEAMEATTIEYTPIVLSNNSTLEKPEVETWKNLKMNAYLTPDIVAKYHMNPSYFDVTKIKSMKVVSDDKEYVEVGNTRAAASAPSVVEGSWLNSKDGMLSATINLDANAVKDDPSHVTVLAVQACFNGKDGKDSVVTSDYAAVAKSTIRNVVIADPEVKGTSCTMEKFHVYTFAKDAIANDPTHDLVYNDPEGIDLTKLVQAHFIRNNATAEQAMEDVSKYGMKWEFAVSHYTAGGNKTSESAHIYLKDNHAIACTVDASGKPQPGSQDRSSIGRLPMVRVTLVDTTKTENNIVAVGFIKLEIVKEADVPAEAIDVNFDGKGYDLSCTGYNQTLTWAQIEDQVLGKLNLSKEEFETQYKIEKNNGVVQLYANTENGPAVATQYGKVEELKDAGGHTTNVLSWTVTANEICKAVWDVTKVAYKTGVNLETGVKFVRNDGDITKPAVYVWFHTGTITTPTAALENSAKISNRWAATNGEIGSGFAEIHDYVGEPNDPNQPNKDVLTFKLDLLSCFAGGKVSLTTTGSDAFKENLNYEYKFIITEANQKQVGLSGTKYRMSTSADGHLLFANAGQGTEIVAELDGSVVKYNETGAYAQDLLNAASHKDLAHTVTATVGIYVTNACDMPLPVENNTFDVKFLRPINVAGAEGVAFTDAKDGGNQADLYKLLTFTDWRDTWKDNFVQAPNDGYGVTSITPDINDITTDMNNGTLGETLLSSITKDIIFKKVANAGKPYGGVTFGQLVYENVGHVTSTFKVRVPLTVTYYWGEVKTSVDITVNATQGNKVARR